MLIDARFIDPAGKQGLDCFVVRGLTWQGQDFVDTIRDPVVWKRTMEAVKKVGDVSFDVLVGIAKLELKRFAAEKLGLAL